MIRFVVRRHRLRNRNDHSVVKGFANNQDHTGTTDYLNVSEMLMVKGSAVAKEATIRSILNLSIIRLAPA
jgi:hypothetical protein